MDNTRPLGAICALIVLIFLSSTTNASTVLNPGHQAGGDVIPLAENLGFTDIDVSFITMTPIVIDFDPLASPSDILTINLIDNLTGTPWTGIDFTFLNATIISPIDITPQTGLVDGIFFDTGAFIPNVTTSVSISFSPGSPEISGLDDGSGNINTSLGLYSLVITPTAVPIPAAVWLFGSGLVALMGIARGKKSS